MRETIHANFGMFGEPHLRKTGALFLIDLHHANTKYNIPFQSVALEKDDNNNNHNNTNSGTIYDTMSSRMTLSENASTCFTCSSWRASRDAWRQPSALRDDVRLCECVYCQKSLRYSREFCGSLFISHKVKNVSSQKINTLRFFSQHWINRHLDFNSSLLKERGKITQKLLAGKG